MRPVREIYSNATAVYFVSTHTAGRKPFFRHERWARLLMTTLAHYAEKDFLLHAYVIMPDHLNLLITPGESLEKAAQLIKRGFSFRARRELDYSFDIWQPGFTDHRIRDDEDWGRHLHYIRSNPVEAQLVEDSVFYEFMGFPTIAFPRGLKPRTIDGIHVGTEARTLQPEARIPRPDSLRDWNIDAVKGTGFSPSVKAAPSAGALAPEGGKR